MQRDLLLPWRTVLENVILGPELAGKRLGDVRATALTLMGRFGLRGFENSYPAVLSGGMRQRAALRRTILCERSVILLDEPFGALDALTRAAMHGWLLGIKREFNHTMILITHDPDEAVYLSDRVYVASPRPMRIAHGSHSCEDAIERKRIRKEDLPWRGDLSCPFALPQFFFYGQRNQGNKKCV
jgi:ABC-type nitrate/sulfonate/bicarbonate transport system ATPase subunit